jgi:glycine hydroxymethyltransferase
MDSLKERDREISLLIEQERTRQEETINLIASENYTSKAVREASGSVLTNKYAEGFPGKRYYAGCEYVDKIETLAQERCKKIFGAEYVNVQPHAGSQANLAAYFALLNPGETIMGMSLAEGGHLTHGHPVNISGKIFKSVQYTVDRETELLDYDTIATIAKEHRPKLIIAGASAYSRHIDFHRFSSIAQEVGAYLIADIAHIAGLVAVGLHPNPFPFADIVTTTTHKTLRGPRGGLAMCKLEHAQSLDRAIMPGTQGGPFMQIIAAKAVAFKEALEPSFRQYGEQIIKNTQVMAKSFQNLGYRIVAGGTDNHLFVIDLRNKKLTGKLAQEALESVNIIISRSCIPFDPEKPWITSGIRIGSPAITTRGIKEEHAEQIVRLIDETLHYYNNTEKLKKIKYEVIRFCKEFPIDV